jgi:uncharacterized protein (TIGR02270 family)
VAADREHLQLQESLGADALRSAAAWALGFAGTRAAADACLDLVLQDLEAPLACEAFCSITGLDLEAGGLREPRQRPDEDAPVAFDDDDLDADLVPAADDDLPRADAARVARWWDQNRGRFSPEQRYLEGRPLDDAALIEALARGKMRRRHTLALAFAIRTRGRLQLNTRAWGGAYRPRRLRR